MTIRFTIQMTIEDDTTEAPVVHQVIRIDRDELEAETLGASPLLMAKPFSGNSRLP